jgi:hypothetical protein
MPIDTHVRVAAWLHIVLGVIAACVLGVVGLSFGVFGAAVGASAHGQDAGVLGWIAGFGVALLLLLMAFPVLEIVGGVLLLGGSAAGRIITIVFSILSLINIPIGTAIGAYSLWALLREQPKPAPAAAVMEPGVRPY